MLDDLRFRARALFRRSRVEAELDAELREHLAVLARRHRTAGCTPEEAERRARLDFGGLDQIKDACREARGTALVEHAWRDVRHAVRLLRRDAALTAMAVLTLTLGIGASTAAVSVVRGVLLQPLPYGDAGRIAFLWGKPPAGVDVGFDELPWSRVAFQRLSRETDAFAFTGAFLNGQFNLTGAGDPERVDGLRVSSGFLPALGIEPALGRTFTADDDRAGHEPVVILGDRLWRDRFGADPSVVGRGIDLNGAPYTVIGVMPPGFVFPRDIQMPGSFVFPREAELWIPLALPTGPPPRGEPSEIAVVARLAPGQTFEQAQAELDLFAARMEREFPRARGWFNSRVVPLPQQATGEAKRPIWLLSAAVVVVLLLACANVAGLLLTRAMARAREFRLRAALGAGRRQILRQLVTESLVLSLAGGTSGVALAGMLTAGIRTFGPPGIPRLAQVGVDGWALAFAVALSAATGLLFGLAPAFAAAGGAIHASAREGRGGTAGVTRLRRALLVAEVALALVLLAASGLLVRTFVHLLGAGGGFDAERVLTFELTLPSSRYPDLDRMVPLYQRALERLRDLPGVRAAGVGETVPMGGAGESTGVRIPGRTAAADQPPPYANYTVVSPDYFAAVGTPILRGRAFLDSDTAASQPVAIVSEAMAKKYWPGQDVIGKAVSLPIYAFDMTIVGVAADVKHQSFREVPGPEMYVPLTQKPWPSLATLHVALRTSGDPTSVTASARSAIRTVDSDLPIANVRTLQTVAGDAIVQPRFAMLVLIAFGALALVLACVGLYGAVSVSVALRTQEIGVRMALGATRLDVLAMVLGEGLRIAGAGIVFGTAASLVVLRTMSGFLYRVAPTDPPTFGLVASLLLGVALLASYVPARRATRVDPMVALRSE